MKGDVVDDLYVDEDVCPWSMGVCVCVWDGILVVTCGALSANLRVITEKEGSVFSVCAIFL